MPQNFNLFGNNKIDPPEEAFQQHALSAAIRGLYDVAPEAVGHPEVRDITLPGSPWVISLRKIQDNSQDPTKLRSEIHPADLTGYEPTTFIVSKGGTGVLQARMSPIAIDTPSYGMVDDVHVEFTASGSKGKANRVASELIDAASLLNPDQIGR